jgi:hypothetical protein
MTYPLVHTLLLFFPTSRDRANGKINISTGSIFSGSTIDLFEPRHSRILCVALRLLVRSPAFRSITSESTPEFHTSIGASMGLVDTDPWNSYWICYNQYVLFRLCSGRDWLFFREHFIFS